jgi:SAM-dependent methyltransferase
LLAEAALVNIITPVVLLQLNMNNPLPFVPGSFDYVISTFAIYYVEDVTLIAEDIRRVLKRHGEFIFIGPTDKNARELYDLNKMVFKIDRTERIDKRTNRIEKEFYPVMSKLFKHVTTMIIPNKLIFPNKKEYLKYYLATLLFEESVKEANRKFDLHHLEEIDLPSLEISKEMIMLRGESAD